MSLIKNNFYEKRNGLYVVPAFRPLYTDDWHIFSAEGGRGGAKSFAFADYILVRAASASVRSLCAREVKESTKESIHSLLRERILAQGRKKEFKITDHAIRGLVYGSEIMFEGLLEHTVETIKSYADVDILYLEEAQSVSRRSLNVIIPTIRKRGSKILLSYNRFEDNDPCHEYFEGMFDTQVRMEFTDEITKKKFYWIRKEGIREIEDPETGRIVKRRALGVKINYDGNPKFTLELEEKRLKDLRDAPELYPHIWLGEPIGSGTFAILSRTKINAACARKIEPDESECYYCGIDVAGMGRDRSVLYLRRGDASIQMRTYAKLDQEYVADMAELLCRDYDISEHDIVFNVDDTGLGSGVSAALARRGWSVNAINFGAAAGNKRYLNVASELWFSSRDILDKISIINDDELKDELAGRRWKPNNAQKYIAEPKEEFKKRTKKSPDKADAFNLAFYNNAHLFLRPNQTLAGLSAY